MTSDEADELMRQSLASFGFDYSAPDAKVAWTAFKATLDESVETERCATLGYSSYNAADRDDVLWLFFGRQFDEGPLATSGCLFSTVVPENLVGVDDENWWWAEHVTLAEWVAEVEANAIFRQCVDIAGWRWMGFNS